MRLYQAGNRFKGCVASLRPLTRAVAVLLFLPLSISCGPAMTASPVPSDDLDRESLRVAVQRSISYLEKLPPDRIVGEQPRPFTAKEVLDVLREFERLLNRWDCEECWKKEFAARFE